MFSVMLILNNHAIFKQSPEELFFNFLIEKKSKPLKSSDMGLSVKKNQIQPQKTHAKLG
jgi:hypothetical protein